MVVVFMARAILKIQEIARCIHLLRVTEDVVCGDVQEEVAFVVLPGWCFLHGCCLLLGAYVTRSGL